MIIGDNSSLLSTTAVQIWIISYILHVIHWLYLVVKRLFCFFRESSFHLVDGNWARWQSWSVCTKSCGGGTQDRTRTCSNPPPAYGGGDCRGDNKEVRSCNNRPCPGRNSVWNVKDVMILNQKRTMFKLEVGQYPTAFPNRAEETFMGCWTIVFAC